MRRRKSKGRGEGFTHPKEPTSQSNTHASAPADAPLEPGIADYLADVARYPTLSLKEERCLVDDLLKEAGNGRQIRERLIEGTLARACQLAHSYQGRGVELAELIGTANLALVLAATSFTPARGRLFRSYALQRTRWLLLSIIGDVQAAPASNEDEEGQIPLPLELPFSLPVADESQDQALRAELALAPEEVSADDERAPLASLFDVLAHSQRFSYEEEAFDRDHAEIEHLRTGLATLPPRVRQILELRYRLGEGEEASDQLCPLKEIGACMGMSQERVRQLAERGLQSLRRYFSRGCAPPRQESSRSVPPPKPSSTSGPPAKPWKRTPARDESSDRPVPTRPPVASPQLEGERKEVAVTAICFTDRQGVPLNRPVALPESARSLQRDDHTIALASGGRGKSMLVHSALLSWPSPALPALRLPDDGSIAHLAWSPDGAYLALVSSGGSVWVYHLHDGEVLFYAHYQALAASPISWSPDGKYLAAASSAGGVRTFDVHTGHIHQHYRAHSAQVHSLSFSPGGRRFASADRHAVHIWDYPLAQVPTTLICTPPWWRQVTQLAWAPDGRCLALSTRLHPLLSRLAPLSWLAPDERILICDSFTGEQLAAFSLSGMVQALAWTPDGDYLCTLVASSPSTSSACIWSVHGGALLGLSRGSGQRWMRWSGAGQFSVLERDGYLTVLTVPTATTLSRSQIIPKEIAAAAWSPDERYLAFIPTGERGLSFCSLPS